MLQVGLKGEPFSSVQKALDFLKMHPEEERYILVRPGVYKERVVVGIPGVVITGESREAMERTVITLGLGAREILFWGRKKARSLPGGKGNSGKLGKPLESSEYCSFFH